MAGGLGGMAPVGTVGGRDGHSGGAAALLAGCLARKVRGLCFSVRAAGIIPGDGGLPGLDVSFGASRSGRRNAYVSKMQSG